MWDAPGFTHQARSGLWPVNQARAATSSTALSQFFVNEGTLGDTLLRVSELACQVLPADFAGITMLVEGKPSTGVFTDREAPEIDEAQYSSGQGPCLDAFQHQRVNRIDSTADDQRWPDFAKMALAHGILATLSVPVIARGQSLGALNLIPIRRRRSMTTASTGSRPLLGKQPSSWPTPRSTGTPDS